MNLHFFIHKFCKKISSYSFYYIERIALLADKIFLKGEEKITMKRKLNKWLSGVLAACVLFTTVPVYAINDVSGTETSTEVVETSEETQSSEIETSSAEETVQESSESTKSSEITSEQTSEIADEMLNISPMNLGDEDEPSTDNWELGLVFYDSTVDNGKTPLTSIDWDASDGDYKEGTPRVITVQINYKNTNAVTTYQPGDLEISIPNLCYSNSRISGTAYDAQWSTKIIVGANDSTHTGFAWDFTTGKNPTNSQKTYTFANANIIEEKSNFEGSIQIAYTITPQTETPEEYIDECTHNFSKSLQATLNNALKSNEILFSYKRVYAHLWQETPYTIEKTAAKIQSLDGFGSNANNYIWVKYDFKISDGWYSEKDYPYIKAEECYIKDIFPSNCIVLDENQKELEQDENNMFIVSDYLWGNSYTRFSDSVYVGYPKSIYNEQNNNLKIENTAELYVKYYNSTELKYQDNDSVVLNLNDFEFNYEGELYGITKKEGLFQDHPLYYQSITGEDMQIGSKGLQNFEIYGQALYTGKTMDVKIGDDLLYITDQNGDYRKLNSGEYYFSTITFPTQIFNGNDIEIEKNKYDIELWLKTGNSNSYNLYDTFKNGTTDGQYEFSKSDNVTGFYFIIKNMEESLRYHYGGWGETFYPDYGICTDIQFTNVNNISSSGSIWNFSYLQVYIDGVLQNEPDLSSYANFITQDEIANYDITTYGTYMQRAAGKVDYSSYKIADPSYNMFIHKSMSTFTQDHQNETFKGTASLGIRFIPYAFWTEHEVKTYSSTIPDSKKIVGWEMFDLLPEGMTLSSTQEEILDSVSATHALYDMCKVYDKKGTQLSKNAIKDLIKKNSSVEIINNYNNTNRTYIRITIAFESQPISILPINLGEGDIVSAKYNYEVSYDNFIEYGNVWTNRAYGQYYNRELDGEIFKRKDARQDSGYFDKAERDINQNNNTVEYIMCTSDSETITSVVSTHQDVQTQVQSTLSNYSTGIVDAEYGKNYSYKLRVRSGENDVTNLVIYDNLEKWAKDKDGNFIEAAGKKQYWQGEFLGIDTSYAESKGYTVKVWYSENEKAGTLAEDTSWKEYSDTVDKTKVKSLAFQYLDSEGKPAILPANSLTYVEINMKAPADEKITTLAYNGCWTQWNALDDFGQPVDFITGINSNIVKVALPNSIIDDELPTVTLKFIKEISGTDSDFENMLLDKAEERNFRITLTSLTANEDGSYNQITGLLSSTQGLTLSKVPIGTYLITESDDIYFDFVEMVPNNDEEIIIDGVTLEKTDKGYVLTISDDLSGDVEFNIKVTNKIEPDRPYEDKEEIENLFKIPSVDT